jgi:hypothetical protein
MYAVRRWSVRHAAGMETFYNAFERVFVGLHPLWKWVGYERAEKPVGAVRFEFDRYVVLHELPEEFAQWSLRRCACQREL